MADVFWCNVTGQGHRLHRHYHDTYAFGFIHSGRSRYHCGSHQFETDPATSFLTNPGDVHTGFPASDEPISYTTFHVPVDYVRSLTGLPYDVTFGQYLSTDARIAAAMREAAATGGSDLAMLALEGMLASVLPLLLGAGRPPPAPALHVPGLRRARDLLASNLARPVPLQELAAAAHMERSHFVRQFKRHFGLPPHQLLIQMRVVEARKRIFAGEAAADAAVAAGFSDQSHLIRCWRAVYAAPPGKTRKVTFVQAPAAAAA